ncbi:unnamed protein product, partial [Chrysoparadoxa australica]
MRSFGRGCGGLVGAALLSLCEAQEPYTLQLGAPWPSPAGPLGRFNTDFVFGEGPTNTGKVTLLSAANKFKASGVISRTGWLYIGSQSDDTTSPPTLYGVDTADGTNAWQLTTGFENGANFETGAIITSQTHSTSGTLDFIITAASGVAVSSGSEDNSYIYGIWGTDTLAQPIAWQYPAASAVGGSSLLGKVSAPGAVDDQGRVYFGTVTRDEAAATGGSSGVLALDSATGAFIWRTDIPGGVTTTPIISGTAVLVVGQGVLYALDRSTGTVLSSVSLITSDSSTNTGEGNDPCVYTGEDRLTDAQPTYGIRSDLVIGVHQCVLSVSIADPASPSIRWTRVFAGGRIFTGSVSVDWDGYYIAGDVTGSIYSLSSETGSSRWPEGQLQLPNGVNAQLSEGPIVLGDQSILFVDTNNAQLFGVKNEDGALKWTYDMATELSMRTSTTPAVNSDGGLLFGSTSSGAKSIFRLGGAGGCAKGTHTVDTSLIAADAPQLCNTCQSGQISTSVSSDTCSTCNAGFWQGVERSSFCFVCGVDAWCEGGDACAFGHDGVACSECLEGYFPLGDACRECPQGSFFYSVLFVLFVFGLVGGILKYTGANSYVSGTKFTHELAPNDQISVRIDGQPVVRMVASVKHDFSVILTSDFDLDKPLTGKKFKIRKYRKTGVSKWKDGTGLVSIPDKEGNLPKESLKTKVVRFAVRLVTCKCREMCCKRKEEYDEGEDPQPEEKKIEPQIKGTATSGIQILATATVLGLTFMQTNALLAEMDLDWPPALDWTGTFGSFINLNLPSLMLAPSCSWNFSYQSQWLFAITSPLILLLGLWIVYKTFVGRYANPQTKRQLGDRCVQTGMIIITLMFVFITAKAMEPLDCTIQDNGKSYMDADPSIECTYFQGTYGVLSTLAIFFFLFYGIGIPTYVFRVLTVAKHQNRMGDIRFIQRYGWLYLRYNRDYYWWELVVLARKLLLVLGTMLASQNPDAQAEVALVIMIFFFVWHAYVRPFTCYDCLKSRKKRCRHWSSNDRLEIGLDFGTIMILLFGWVQSTLTGTSQLVVQALMIVVMAGSFSFLGVVLLKAYIKQEKDEKAMEEDGQIA